MRFDFFNLLPLLMIPKVFGFSFNAPKKYIGYKQIRQTLVNDINRFYDQTGNANKEFETPDFYNVDPKDSKNLQFESTW